MKTSLLFSSLLLVTLFIIGCDTDVKLPDEPVPNMFIEADSRSSCVFNCDHGCNLSDDLCCCYFFVTFPGNPNDIIFCKGWDAQFPDCFIDSIPSTPCKYNWFGIQDSLSIGFSPICLVSDVDFFIANFSPSDTITIEIACASGCVDFRRYWIDPGERFYFTVDSLCNHMFCGSTY
ncbi:MAG: hypothetical protein EA409_06825 [Saprospirales bacterium]|nr:MAG: hypothetical protein EA409_06825 [Saprospirales bacterium]